MKATKIIYLIAFTTFPWNIL